MIRAVFFDIDGTLVSLKTKRCPDSTKAAIRALREKGIRVYVASGQLPLRAGGAGDAPRHDV